MASFATFAIVALSKRWNGQVRQPLLKASLKELDFIAGRFRKQSLPLGVDVKLA
jgi:hypothetical protein